jgi:hypothetical protein
MTDEKLTHDFGQTITERAPRDPDFVKALLDEAASLFLKASRIPHGLFCAIS